MTLAEMVELVFRQRKLGLTSVIIKYKPKSAPKRNRVRLHGLGYGTIVGGSWEDGYYAVSIPVEDMEKAVLKILRQFK